MRSKARSVLYVCIIACVVALSVVLGHIMASKQSETTAEIITRDLTGQGFKVVEVTNVWRSEANATVRIMNCNFMLTALKDGERWNAYTDGDRSFPPVSNDELTSQLKKQARGEPVELIMFPLSCDEPA